MTFRIRRRPRGIWADVAALTAWLDANAAERPRWWWTRGRRRAAREHELTLRIAKCGEESGEAVDARIRALGQNPRKGTTATAEDVANELCDVAVTALVALTTQLGDVDAARTHLNTRLAAIRERAAA